VPPKPHALEALRTRLELGRRKALRGGAVLGVVALTLGTLVATGVAGDFIKIFSPETFVAVPIDIRSLGSLPDLSGFGTTKVLQEPTMTTAAGPAEAAAATGLHLLSVGKLPSTISGEPTYRVISEGKGSLTFNSAAASATAGKLGSALPALPPKLDGSTLTLDAGPIVVETIGTAQQIPGMAPGETSGFLSVLGGIPQLVIVEMKAPTLYSDGPTVAQYEEALLSMPGIPPALASEIRSLGDLSSTLPIPIPKGQAAAHPVDVNGAQGLVIGDTSGIVAGVVWQSHGLVYGVAGLSLTDRQVVAIARSMH
jgi:hypothetical protein